MSETQTPTPTPTATPWYTGKVDQDRKSVV